MSDSRAQSYATHRRWNPLYHFVVAPLLVANVVVAAVATARAPSLVTTWALVMAVTLFLVAGLARLQALTVQNRVIRLEMRLRLAQLLPSPLLARAARLRTGQLLALRFASDAELPGLVERVLDGGLETPNAIKREVRDWQGDWLRA